MRQIRPQAMRGMPSNTPLLGGMCTKISNKRHVIQRLSFSKNKCDPPPLQLMLVHGFTSMLKEECSILKKNYYG